MKNIQKIGLLFAVVLAAGSAGVWSELQQAKAVPQAAPPNRNGMITAFTVFPDPPPFDTPIEEIFGSISDNDDGTAFVQVQKDTLLVSDCGPGFICFENIGTAAFGFEPANMSYSLTVDVRPGASGHQIGSGMGSATVAGTLLDFNTFEETPVTISFQMAVQGASDVYAFNNHTIDVHHDPLSGSVTASRNKSKGTAASGAAAASASMSVDGAPYYSATGIFGQVEAFTNHTVTHIQ